MPYSHRPDKRPRLAEADDDDDDEQNIVQLVKPSTLYYRGEIKEPQATRFCMKLRKASDTLQSASSDAPIRVYLSSHGGDVHAGISMYSHILAVKRRTPVHVIVDGYCASAATLPLLAASRRMMAEYATLLVHAVTSYTWGGYKPCELKEESQNLDTLMHLLSSMYLRHSGISKKALRALLKTDRLLTFDECVEYGFVEPAAGLEEAAANGLKHGRATDAHRDP